MLQVLHYVQKVSTVNWVLHNLKDVHQVNTVIPLVYQHLLATAKLDTTASRILLQAPHLMVFKEINAQEATIVPQVQLSCYHVPQVCTVPR